MSQLEMFACGPSTPARTTTTDCTPVAVFSTCGAYRYQLASRWDPTKDPLVWVMLNPSKAGQTRPDGKVETDMTYAKCCGFAERWGFGGVVLVNLYAYIETQSHILDALAAAQIDLVGPDNDAHLDAALAGARGLVAVASFVTDTEVVTVREHADRWVRIEAPRVRASVLPMEGDGPRLVLGASMPSNADDVHELNAGLLQDDRDYALAQARYLVGAIERLVGEPHVLRTLPLPGALTTLAHGADEGGAPEFAVSLRFVAEACQHHGLGWPDLDATRAQA